MKNVGSGMATTRPGIAETESTRPNAEIRHKAKKHEIKKGAEVLAEGTEKLVNRCQTEAPLKETSERPDTLIRTGSSSGTKSSLLLVAD